jgi:hypothetical protein
MIEGKVAAIIDGESVVINVGKQHGVRPGMRFKAIYRTGRIVDPDDPTNVLAGLTLVIGEMRANSVLDSFTYCAVDNPLSPTLSFTLPQIMEKKSIVDLDQPLLVPEGSLKIRVGTLVQETESGQKPGSVPRTPPR